MKTTMLFATMGLLLGCSAGVEDAGFFKKNGQCNTPGDAGFQETSCSSTGTGGATTSSGGSAATSGTSNGGSSSGGSVSGGTSTFGEVTSGGATTSSGGSPATSGSSNGGSSSGGSAVAGAPSAGSASGGASACIDWTASGYFGVGLVARINGKTFECVSSGCSGTKPGTDADKWLATACDASCQSCDLACDSPTVGYEQVSGGVAPWTAYPDYLADVLPGWTLRVQLADGCTLKTGKSDGTNCSYDLGYQELRCVGSLADCRRYDPRFEFCSPQSLAGTAAPCRDVSVRPTSPWVIVGPC